MTYEPPPLSKDEQELLEFRELYKIPKFDPAVFTPGHAADHICLAMTAQDGTKVLFSADHVMSWSSSIVSPPFGDMAKYFDSLKLLLDRDDEIFLPGHGPKLPAPRDLVRDLLRHREAREAALAAELVKGKSDTHALMNALYSQVDPRLRKAAERNVLAHLLKLETEGRVVPRRSCRRRP